MKEMDVGMVRQALSSIDDQLIAERIIYVRRYGKRVYAIVSIECLSALLDTIEIMSDAKSHELLQSSLDDIREGRIHDHRNMVKQLDENAP